MLVGRSDLVDVGGDRVLAELEHTIDDWLLSRDVPVTPMRAAKFRPALAKTELLVPIERAV